MTTASPLNLFYPHISKIIGNFFIIKNTLQISVYKVPEIKQTK